MNKAKLKSYAPQARKDFIAAVTARANLLGLSDKAGMLEVAQAQPQGDMVVIAGQAWPIKVQAQREQLVRRIRKDGFAQTMEAVAYTWFNRFAALRYMELHDYLGHGHRALSNTVGTLPDILTHAADLAQSSAHGEGLPGLNVALVTEMKLAGNRDGELYRMLLVAQCNALSAAMPFLFEHIDDETELLLPDNLLRTDSVIARLVNAIDEEDWKEVEIIGWLYQFYISEKKDEVIGKVVKSEDIPAATQLFTPNWIVQYLVQNSVGRLWLMANPASTLKSQWPYYIEPAQQTPEVQAQLDVLIQTRMDEDGGSLNPESITLLDPACGSGHILVEAYEVLKAIYLERGYQPRTIPRLILEKNLFGLDIDDRAAQMAGFALLMKARADDRRLFTATDAQGNPQPPKLNVLALQSSQGLNADALAQALQPDRYSSEDASRHSREGGNPVANDFAPDDLFPSTIPQMTLGESVTAPAPGRHSREGGNTAVSWIPAVAGMTDIPSAIARLLILFSHAKTFGSLIQIGLQTKQDVRKLLLIVQQSMETGDLYAKAAAQDLLPLLQQAQVLAMQFDAVVANPPYMGGKGMNPALKDYAKTTFPNSKSDLFAMFMERGFEWCKPSGFISMVTMQSWMFLSSYESIRTNLLNNRTISNFLQIGYNSFPEINSKVAQACAFVIHRIYVNDFVGVYINLNSASQSANKDNVFISRNNNLTHNVSQSDFLKIPGAPLAYWIDNNTREIFITNPRLEDIGVPRSGITTGDNESYLRSWFEIAKFNKTIDSIKYELNIFDKWVPLNGGGDYRKWYGNNLQVIFWEKNGQAIKNDEKSTIANLDYQFKAGVTWSKITSSNLSVRLTPTGFIFSAVGLKSFPSPDYLSYVCGFLNSKVVEYFKPIFSSTLSILSGDIGKLPFIVNQRDKIDSLINEAVKIAKFDWDSSEVSWDFEFLDWIRNEKKDMRLSFEAHEAQSTLLINQLRLIEEENNRIFINAYGLQDELTPEVPESQITLARADREKDCQRLLSYAIGCMMGRYSLDAPGLIYANSGNVGFDPSRYTTFPADADGIVPLTDELWFEDDAANRISEFLLAVWGADTLAENMAWLATSLGTKASETPDETIRRYLADKFYKDHLQTYKKRPIYWLFSSGKQGAFQALVYLHRYHEGTLARLRAQYVVPLTGKIQSRIDMLQKDAAAASSTAARNKLAKEVEKLKKKHAELLAYDEILRHHADMRITLDLDDGVKVNYGRFGDLLDSVKVVTGGASDD
jgi:hypothetical protein